MSISEDEARLEVVAFIFGDMEAVEDEVCQSLNVGVADRGQKSPWK